MTENNKPEWFEITDSDEKPQLRKVSKSLPISGVLVAALILGVGVFVSQSPDLAPISSATAAPENNSKVQTPATSRAVAAAKSAVATPSKVATAAAAVLPSTVATVAAAATGLTNPSIAKLPTGGDDDDDDDEDEDDDDDDDDDDDEDDEEEDENDEEDDD